MIVTPMADRVLNTTFAALADPTRRAIIARLAAGEASVSELAEPFAMSQPAISSISGAGARRLISHGRDAQRRPRRLEGERLAAATRWLERYRASGRATTNVSTCCSTR